MTTTMLQVHVAGIGLLGPGLPDWATGQAALREPATWTNLSVVVPPPARMPATERRRAGTVVKASMGVADQACAAAGLEPADLATVFTSSTGDPANCHALCEALAGPDRLLSPTRFTNSVHNAAAGYWHIATRSMQPSTSLGAFDASFGAGLLEAASMCAAGGRPVLLVACDAPYPEPLHALRPIPDVFAVALVMASGPGPRGTLQLSLLPEREATRCEGDGLEALRRSNPAARALPLLQALARGGAWDLVIEGLPGLSLRLQLETP